MDTQDSNTMFRTFDDLVDEISRYSSFYTVAEHRQRDEELAETHDHVEHRVLQETEAGHEVSSLTIGSGEKTALLFGAPHPNEPIGSMTLDFFSHKLAEDTAFRQGFNYTFVIIKVIDVDGTVLNEGWFDGPFTISNYAQNFYRPASYEQIEWSFPFEYKDYSFDDPEPGTEALMELIESHEPEFVYSLHNAGFGGCYYYLSDDIPAVYDDLRRISRERDVPLDLGEPEAPYMEEFDDAIYEMSSATRSYDYYEEHGNEDPADIINNGAGSYDYACEFNDDAFLLVTELPYFYDPKIESEAVVDESRREANLKGIDRGEAVVEFLAEQYERVADDLSDSRFKRAVEELVEQSPQRLVAQRKWAESDPDLEETATEAQAFDARTVSEFYRLLYFGPFMRAIDHEQMVDDENDELLATKRAVEEEFTSRIGGLLDEFEYTAIPIWKLVAIQVQAGLLCLDYLERTDHFK